MPDPTFPFRGVILQLGLACPLRCEHCYVGAGPDKTDALPSTAIERILTGFGRSDLGSRTLAVTGGEPFMMPEALSLTLHLANSFKLNTYINTSGFFGKTVDCACRVLARYPRFRRLEVSIDRYHEAFVPRRFALNTAIAAHRLGLEVQFALQEDEWERDPSLRKAVAALPSASLYMQQLVPVGERNTYRDSDWKYGSRGPQGGCAKVGTLLFDEYGHAYPCCGTVQMERRAKGNGLAGFSLGTIHDLSFDEIVARLRVSQSLFLVHKIGPLALARFLDAPDSCQGRGYCDTCIDLHVNGRVAALAEPRRKELVHLALRLGQDAS